LIPRNTTGEQLEKIQKMQKKCRNSSEFFQATMAGNNKKQHIRNQASVGSQPPLLGVSTHMISSFDTKFSDEIFF
jgi:hypothetical protein